MARLARPKAGETLYLLANLRRGVYQKPRLTVRADGDTFLGARGGLQAAGAHPLAVFTTTVPLRKAATGC